MRSNSAAWYAAMAPVSSTVASGVLGLLREGMPGWKKNVASGPISWWSVEIWGRHVCHQAMRPRLSRSSVGSQSRLMSKK